MEIIEADEKEGEKIVGGGEIEELVKEDGEKLKEEKFAERESGELV